MDRQTRNEMLHELMEDLTITEINEIESKWQSFDSTEDEYDDDI